MMVFEAEQGAEQGAKVRGIDIPHKQTLPVVHVIALERVLK